jgi:hypothetical protein
MSKDLAHNITATLAMAAEDFSATTNGTVINTAGYESLTFIINVGANTGNAFDATHNITFTVQKDSVVGFGTPTTLTAATGYLVAKTSANATWDRILDAAADDEQVYTIGVNLDDPDNGFYRLVATEAGTVSTVDLYAEAILAHPIHAALG